MSILLKTDSLNNADKLAIASSCTFRETKSYKRSKYGKSYPEKEVTTYTCSNKELLIPLHLGLQICQERKLTPIVNCEHRSYENNPFELRVDLWPHQEWTLQNAPSLLSQERGVTISLYPGAGKTVVGAALMSMSRLFSLVVMTSTSIMEQWVNTLEERTTAKYAVVGGTKKNFPNAVDYNNASVIISMIDRVKNIPAHIRKQIGVLLVDESHMFCTSKRSCNLLQVQPLYVILESATPFKKKGLHSVSKAIAGPSVILLEYNRPYTLCILNIPLSPVMEYDMSNNLEYDPYKKSIMYDERQNALLFWLMVYNPGKKILFMTEETAHADLIAGSLIPFLGEASVSRCYGEHKRYNDASILIGTTRKLGVGFDEAQFCADFAGRRLDMLVLALTYADEAYIIQLLGRVLRATDAVIVVFRNLSHVSINQCSTISKYINRKKNGQESLAKVVSASISEERYTSLVDEISSMNRPIVIEDSSTLFLPEDQSIETNLTQSIDPVLLEANCPIITSYPPN